MNLKNKYIIGCIFLVYGCYPNHEVERNTPYDYEYPTTKKEIHFMQYLIKNGYKDPKFRIPIYGAGPIGARTYSLDLVYDTILQDSILFEYIQKERKEIACNLYENVIEDSVIYDLYEIRVDIRTQKAKNFKINYTKDYYWTFKKSDLQKWQGFKVIKIGKRKYKRINIR